MVRLIQFISLTAVLVLSACDRSAQKMPVQAEDNQEPVYQKEYARVRKYKGVYVFINSQPVNPYEELGTISASLWDDLKIEKGEKAGSVVRRISNSVKEHVTVNELMEKVIALAVQKHPEAEGVIFNDRMNSCQVIQFEK